MGSKNIARDTPLAELTLRRYEKPADLDKRELVRKLCLSVGLLQPGDSRDVVVDVLLALLMAQGEMSSEDVQKRVVELRRERNLPQLGIAPSNIRRQLKRIRELYLAEKIANNYRITERSTLSEIFAEKIETYLLPSILNRTKEYLSAVDEEFFK